MVYSVLGGWLRFSDFLWNRWVFSTVWNLRAQILPLRVPMIAIPKTLQRRETDYSFGIALRSVGSGLRSLHRVLPSKTFASTVCSNVCSVLTSCNILWILRLTFTVCSLVLSILSARASIKLIDKSNEEFEVAVSLCCSSRYTDTTENTNEIEKQISETKRRITRAQPIAKPLPEIE